MSLLKVLMAAITTAAASELALAVNYVVGAPAGQWNLNINYTTWVSDKKFYPNDTLEFIYTTTHDVTVVSKANYDSCNPANPISFNTGGNTTVRLTNLGMMYFICATPGHCSSGMKLPVNVLAASNSPPSPPPPPGTATPPPPRSSATATSLSAVLVLGVAVMMLLVL